MEIGDSITLLESYYIGDYLDDDRFDGYWPVCDHQGMFSIPTAKAKEEIAKGNLEGIYSEAFKKYF